MVALKTRDQFQSKLVLVHTLLSSEKGKKEVSLVTDSTWEVIKKAATEGLVLSSFPFPIRVD